MTWHFYIVIFLLLVSSMTISSYKILVVPVVSGFNSRLLNLQKLADVLAKDGHEVTVLMNTRVKEHTITKHAKTIEFYVPEEVEDLSSITWPKSFALNIFSTLERMTDVEYNFDKALMNDSETLRKIHDAKYDLIFGDALSLMTNLLI